MPLTITSQEKLIALVSACLTLSACNYSQVRVFHASADSPAVDVNIEKGHPILGLEFGSASPYQYVKPGERQVNVSASASGANVISAVLPLAEETGYTIVALNDLANIEPVVLVDDLMPPATGQLKLRVLHATPSAPPVDVYVTGPTAALPASPTIDGLAFKESTDFLSIDAGTYRVRVTLDDNAAVIYDSGSVPLDAGSNLTIAALPASMGLSPIKLTALTGDALAPTLELIDQRAAVRVVHASPDAPAVDVSVNGAQALTNVPFTASSDYLPLPAGPTEFSVTVAGTSTEVINVAPTLAAGERYTVLATNFVADIEPLLLEDKRPELGATEAGVRVVHASPDAPAVDVLAGGAPVLTGVTYQQASDYLPVPAGSLPIAVNVAGTDTTVLSGTLELSAGTFYTVIATGSVEAGTLATTVLESE